MSKKTQDDAVASKAASKAAPKKTQDDAVAQWSKKTQEDASVGAAVKTTRGRLSTDQNAPRKRLRGERGGSLPASYSGSPAKTGRPRALVCPGSGQDGA